MHSCRNKKGRHVKFLKGGLVIYGSLILNVSSTSDISLGDFKKAQKLQFFLVISICLKTVSLARVKTIWKRINIFKIKCKLFLLQKLLNSAFHIVIVTVQSIKYTFLLSSRRFYQLGDDWWWELRKDGHDPLEWQGYIASVACTQKKEGVLYVYADVRNSV